MVLPQLTHLFSNSMGHPAKAWMQVTTRPFFFDMTIGIFVSQQISEAFVLCRLRAAGKPHEVVITAVARKLVTIVNALCKSGQTWTYHTV